MSAAVETHGLGKRYGRRWGLEDCTLAIPTGRVTALVGPNGAGKTTLLHLVVGLLMPTSGTIEVLGRPLASAPEQTARIGFVAQSAPTYARFSVADHLRLGARLNPAWDHHLAEERIAELGLDPSQRAGNLSGGERAQLALTLALAKRPDLLLLDEPVASLDPLARREFLQSLMEYVAEHGTTVVLSSHLIGDLERICDRLVLLTSSRVRVTGDVDSLLECHHRLVGSRVDPARLPADLEIVEASHTERQTVLLARCDGPIHDPAWSVEPVGLEDLVLAYLRQAADAERQRPALSVVPT